MVVKFPIGRNYMKFQKAIKMKWKYIDDVIDTLPQENKKNILNTMKKYGDNKWWNSNDPLYVARYQVFEDILMVPFDRYHEGIEKLLGRPVYTHEFGLNAEGLKQEVREAIKKLEGGKSLEQTDEYQAQRVVESFKQLADYMGSRDKKVIVARIDRQKPRTKS